MGIRLLLLGVGDPIESMDDDGMGVGIGVGVDVGLVGGKESPWAHRSMA